VQAELVAARDRLLQEAGELHAAGTLGPCGRHPPPQDRVQALEAGTLLPSLAAAGSIWSEVRYLPAEGFWSPGPSAA
jgi:hypothetical protein